MSRRWPQATKGGEKPFTVGDSSLRRRHKSKKRHPVLFRSKDDIFAFIETHQAQFGVTALCQRYLRPAHADRRNARESRAGVRWHVAVSRNRDGSVLSADRRLDTHAPRGAGATHRTCCVAQGYGFPAACLRTELPLQALRGVASKPDAMAERSPTRPLSDRRTIHPTSRAKTTLRS